MEDWEELNNFLTETIGECAHDWETRWAKPTKCLKCGLEAKEPFDILYLTTRFNEWKGFGKLWEWANKQEWWHSQFEHWLICDWKNSKQYGMVKSEMVNPENFARAVADFLQKK